MSIDAEPTQFIGMVTTRENTAIAVYSQRASDDVLVKVGGKKLGTLRPEATKKLGHIFEVAFTKGAKR